MKPYTVTTSVDPDLTEAERRKKKQELVQLILRVTDKDGGAA